MSMAMSEKNRVPEIVEAVKGRSGLFMRYFIFGAVIVMSIVALLVWEEKERTTQNILVRQNSGVVLGSAAIQKQLQRSMSDLLFLADSNEIKEYLATGDPKTLRDLEGELIIFSRGIRLYDQIRFLDETGMEQARVNYANGSPQAVPRSGLQPKGDRTYFAESIVLKPGDIYFSPMDLNVEQGKVEEPLKPMLRLATPVTNASGNRKGIVVLNVFGARLLDDFRSATADIRSSAMLLNSDGYWLVSPDAADEWGFMFKRETTLAKKHPVAWELIRNSDVGQQETGEGLWSWSTVSQLEAFSGIKLSAGSAKSYPWKVVSFVPATTLSAQQSPQLILFILTGLAALCAVGIWSWFHAGSRIKEAFHICQLGQSEAEFRSLFNSMVEGFALHEVITDMHGDVVDYRFIKVNPAFEALTGKTNAEIAGKTLLEVFPNSEKVWIERYGRVALTGVSESFTEFSSETGLWFEVSAYSPAHGQFACVFSDVTANRHLQEQLLQSQKMESIGTLAGGVAHDFNNILTVIMGAGAMLQMKLEGDAELGPFVRQILSSSERAAKLTHNLLAFSRKQTIKPLKVDVNDIVTVMQDFLARIIGEDIALKTVCSSAQLPVCVDRGQIEQVLMNLVVNARDAMPDGGLLLLETSCADSRDHSLELDGCKPGKYALITITDGGIGMDAITVRRIFEPFFTTKEIGYGTGLGLSMAYGIIKQHDGMINVYSEPGDGTVFKIYLPLQGGASYDLPESTQMKLQGGSESILLVEDDPEVRANNSSLLECVGYNVLSASNGEEALKLFERYGGGIALVVLDVIMPGMNGKEVFVLLKVIRPDVKVLFVSGYTAEILNRKGILSEGTNFLPKPLEPHQFLGKVRELLDA